MLNRKFVRTDDAMKDSEETATAFNVSQTKDIGLATVENLKLSVTRSTSLECITLPLLLLPPNYGNKNNRENKSLLTLKEVIDDRCKLTSQESASS